MQEERTKELRKGPNTERIKKKIKEIQQPKIYKVRRRKNKSWEIYETTKKPRDEYYLVK